VLLVDSLVSVHRGLVLGFLAAQCSSSRAGAVDISLGSGSGSSISVNLPAVQVRTWATELVFGDRTLCSLSRSSHVDNLRAVSYPLPLYIY
jgi:hypothetical protein